MVKLILNLKLKHYMGSGNAEFSKQAVCPSCGKINTYIAVCPLVCIACEELLPPFNEMLSNHKAKIMWHMGAMR